MPEPLRDDERVMGSLLRARAEQHPGRPFCHVGDEGFTFAEIDRRSDAVAAGFAAAGVAKGDRVAVLSPNRVEVLEMFYGLAKLGAIQVPLNAFLKGAFLRHQLAHSRASVLVADEAGVAAAEPLLGELPDLRLIVLLDPSASAPSTSGVEVVAYDQLTAGEDAAAPVVDVAPGDTMSIVFTSGTTGLPKGCVLSHGYYARCGWTSAYGLDITPEDSIYAPLPLFHGGGRMLVLTAALVLGIPVHFDVAFSASAFMTRAAEVDATVVIAIGAMGMALLATPPSPSDRAHRVHSMMVAPLTPDEQLRFKERFGIEPWTECYGQTECVPLCVAPRTGERDRAGCGFPAPDLDVRLLDDHLREVPDGEVGEICVRPRGRHAMFDGYWDQPEATLAAFGGLWYHSGDAGRKLPSGQVTFVDRTKDTLRRRGENVSSIELEIAIRAHPKIADAAIHAVPSPVSEDDIKACIVLTPGESTDPEELFAFFGDNLPYFALPRYVELLDDLPRNAVNRVMKHVLRERPMSGQVWDFEALGLRVEREHRRAAPTAAPR
jgi:crotonobetaine/carnitine-CoA ligase